MSWVQLAFVTHAECTALGETERKYSFMSRISRLVVFVYKIMFKGKKIARQKLLLQANDHPDTVCVVASDVVVKRNALKTVAFHYSFQSNTLTLLPTLSS